jgi:tetratricopeptide (TPR) repeat protein
MTNTAHSGYYIEDMIESAHEASRGRNHAVALDLYRQAFDILPDHETLACDIAGQLIHLQRDDDAKAVLRDQLVRWPQSRPGIMQMFHIAQRQGDLSQAEIWLEAALALPRTDPSLIYTKIQLLMRLGRTARARALAARLLQRDPDDVEALIESGHIANGCADHQAALGFFMRALACGPDRPTLACDIAHHLAELGRADEAEALLAARIAAGHGAGFAWRQRARFASQRGDPRATANHFGIASSLLPQDDGLRLDLAYARAALRQFDEAEALLDAIGHRIDQTVLLNARAHFTAWQGNPARAKALWRQGIEATPLHVDCTVSLVHALIDDGAHAEAFRVLDDALSVQPNPFDLVLARADCAFMTGDFGDALARVEALDARHPDTSILLEKLIRFHLAMGSRSKADSLLRSHPSFEANRDATIFLRLRALLAFAHYRFAETADIAREILRRHPSDVEMLVLLANLSFAFGDHADFETHRNSVQTLNESSPSLQARSYARDFLFMDHLANRTYFHPAGGARVKTAFWASGTPGISSLIEILESEPDNISAAISALVTLRADGLTAHMPDLASHIASQSIPKKILQFWDKPNPPDDIAAAMETWRSRCPDYAHHLFDNDHASAYLKAHFDAPVLKAFEGARKPAARSDLFRIAFLYQEGGVHADADDRCLSDMSDWFRNETALFITQETSGALLNAFVAATPRHPFIRFLLDKMVERMIARPGDSIWYTSGPGALTLSFCQFYKEDLRAGRIPKGTKIIDFYELGRHVSTFAVKTYKKTKDHWLHKDNGLDMPD